MTPKEKIIKIQNEFGMKAEVLAKAMSITAATYRQKKSEKSNDHCFNEKNYTDLVEFLKLKIKSLC